ncbi:MAG: hypothetical protein AB7E80_04865 [Hyphomicrobiaceae bacterium]
MLRFTLLLACAIAIASLIAVAHAEDERTFAELPPWLANGLLDCYTFHSIVAESGATNPGQSPSPSPKVLAEEALQELLVELRVASSQMELVKAQLLAKANQRRQTIEAEKARRKGQTTTAPATMQVRKWFEEQCHAYRRSTLRRPRLKQPQLNPQRPRYRSDPSRGQEDIPRELRGDYPNGPGPRPYYRGTPSPR